MNREELVKSFAGIINDGVSDAKLPDYVKKTAETEAARKEGGSLGGIQEEDFLEAMRCVIIHEIGEAVSHAGHEDSLKLAGSIRGRAEEWYRDGTMKELFGESAYEILYRLAANLDPKCEARTIKPKPVEVEKVEIPKSKIRKPAAVIIKSEPERKSEVSDASQLERAADVLLTFYEKQGTIVDQETWQFLPEFTAILHNAGFDDEVIKNHKNYIYADICNEDKITLIQTLEMMYKEQQEKKGGSIPTQSSREAYS